MRLSILAVLAPAAVLVLCVHPGPAAGDPLPIFSATIQGDVATTGNALGLSGAGDGVNAPGLRGSMSTFMAAGLAESDGTFPTGTTSDWTQNRSLAALALPEDARVVRAELVWGASWAGGSEDVSDELDAAILLDTPTGAIGVRANPATAFFVDTVSTSSSRFSVRYYVHSADVTTAVQDGGSGIYGVRSVPATQDAIVNELNAGGWTLYVVYYEPDAATRNLTLFVGAEWIDEDVTTEVTATGFCTPPRGTVNGDLYVSAMEGDAQFTGDTFSIWGANETLIPLEGPRNPATNFFGSQIVGSDGALIEAATFGDRNHEPGVGETVEGGRQGWDMTAIPVSSTTGQLGNSQTTAEFVASTVGDSFMLTSLGFAIDINAPEFAGGEDTVAVFPSELETGEQANVLVQLRNSGQSVASDVLFRLPAVEGVSYVPNTFLIDGLPGDVSGEPVDATELAFGVEVGAIEIGASVTVQFDIVVDAPAPGEIALLPEWTYGWVPCPGEPTSTATAFARAIVINGGEGTGDGTGDAAPDAGDPGDAGDAGDAGDVLDASDASDTTDVVDDAEDADTSTSDAAGDADIDEADAITADTDAAGSLDTDGDGAPRDRDDADAGTDDDEGEATGSSNEGCGCASGRSSAPRAPMLVALTAAVVLRRRSKAA